MSSQIAGYYTVHEAVQVIGRSHSMICRYVRDGLLPAKRIGSQLLIEQSEAHKFTPRPRGNPGFVKKNNSRKS